MKKENITISLEKNQKDKLIERAHKRNLSLKEYFKLLVYNL